MDPKVLKKVRGIVKTLVTCAYKLVAQALKMTKKDGYVDLCREDMARAVVDEIKKMTTDVISDRKFCKAMACYVQEEKRYLFSVTVFDGKAQFSASPKIGKIMEDHPDVMELLKGVF